MDTFKGAPVYDASVVDVAYFDRFDAGPDALPADARVMFGIGPEGGTPIAYLTLCPCEGLAGLVSELNEAGAVAAEFHPPHGVRPT